MMALLAGTGGDSCTTALLAGREGDSCTTALLAGREECMQLHDERGCSYTMTGIEGRRGVREQQDCAAGWAKGAQLRC